MPQVATVLQMPRLWPQTSEILTKASPGKGQKSLMPVGQKNQKKIHAMVAEFHEDGKKALTSVNVEIPRSCENSKKNRLNGLTSNDEAIYSTVYRAQNNDD